VAPSNENDYVVNRNEAIALGKSLFWDMQVGSDGVQSCGACHVHAGADNRVKNQMNHCIIYAECCKFPDNHDLSLIRGIQRISSKKLLRKPKKTLDKRWGVLRSGVPAGRGHTGEELGAAGEHAIGASSEQAITW
jgi:hypothetical protein